MIRGSIPVGWRHSLGILSIIVMIAGYAFLSQRQYAANEKQTTLPGFSELASGVKKAVTPQGIKKRVWLWEDGKATFAHFAYGMTIGVIGAVILGFLMGCFGAAEAFIFPPLNIFTKLNPIAMLAVFFAVIGIGESLYISMVVFGILPALAITVYLAIKHDVPEELIHKSYSLGASHSEIVGLVIGRQVLPRLIEGLRAQIGPALVYLIAAEWIGDSGFGYRLRLQSRLLDMKVVYPYIALLALFGASLDLGLRGLLQWLCPWFIKVEEHQTDDSLFAWLKSLVFSNGKEA
jgi:NitT/TauT family transport system permease protein